jgi:hypothetical protein
MVRDALRATTAAPTFFSPLHRDDSKYCDGAFLANNPTAVALNEVVFYGTRDCWIYRSDPSVGSFPAILAPYGEHRTLIPLNGGCCLLLPRRTHALDVVCMPWVVRCGRCTRVCRWSASCRSARASTRTRARPTSMDGKVRGQTDWEIDGVLIHYDIKMITNQSTPHKRVPVLVREALWHLGLHE